MDLIYGRLASSLLPARCLHNDRWSVFKGPQGFVELVSPATVHSLYHRLKRRIAMTAGSAVLHHVSRTDTPLLLLHTART